MNIKSLLVAGLSTLALVGSAQAAIRPVGNTVDADVSSVIDVGNQTLNGVAIAGGLVSISGPGTYTPASGSNPAVWSWPNSDEFLLQELIFITNGTLDIAAGSVVRGQPDGPGVDFNPGALFICAGAKLICDGGNDTSPIIFTTASTAVTPVRYNPAAPLAFWDATPKTAPADSNVAALWGGLALLGKAPTNVDRDANIVAPAGGNAFGNTSGGTANQVIFGEGYGALKNTFDGKYTSGVAYTGQVTTATTDDRSSIEGVPSTCFAAVNGFDRFGGFNGADNSGVVRYTSLRHGGAELATNNELNGLTVGAVGKGTTIEYVEVYGNTDDGVEIFGGNVNMNHIIVCDQDDDGLDIDVGYQGTIQFLLVVGGTQSDKLCEWDGSYEAETVNGFTVTSPTTVSRTPVGQFNVYNATLIGNTGGVAQGLNIRDQVAPRLVNSIIINPVANGIEIDNRATVLGNTATLQNFKGGIAQFRGVTCYKSGLVGVANWVAGVSNPGVAPQATEADAETALGNSALVNWFTTPGANPDIAGPTAALSALSQIDPTPGASADSAAVDAVLEDHTLSYNPSVDTVFYRGAFEPFAPKWTSAWTPAAVKGVILNN